ncbi:MAG TPA: hypothetical protein VF496_04380 [Candidatus Deferrimicrobium sp.]
MRSNDRSHPGNPCSENCCSWERSSRGQRKGEAAIRPCEIHATIHLPNGKRIAIDKVLYSILDALAVEGSVEHINTVFIRVYRGARKGAVEVSVIHPGSTQNAKKGIRAREGIGEPALPAEGGKPYARVCAPARVT